MRNPSRSLPERCWSTERASQKISNQLCDLVRLLVEREVAAIEDVDLPARALRQGRTWRDADCPAPSRVSPRGQASPARRDDQRNHEADDARERADDQGRSGDMGLEAVPQAEQDAEEAG